jgi:hypothetical protein
MPETSQGVVMDFIERIFGFAPDGGSGSLEFLLFAIPIAGIAYLALRRRQRAAKAVGAIGRHRADRRKADKSASL